MSSEMRRYLVKSQSARGSWFPGLKSAPPQSACITPLLRHHCTGNPRLKFEIPILLPTIEQKLQWVSSCDSSMDLQAHMVFVSANPSRTISNGWPYSCHFQSRREQSALEASSQAGDVNKPNNDSNLSRIIL